MVFDEDYTERIVFQPEELVANSFDVFIRSQRYRELEEEIGQMLGDIKSKVADSQELRQLKSDLTELSQSFKLSRTGIAKNSSGIKGLARGNMIQHIPPGLEPYASFIQSSDCLGWLDWQIRGYSFLDVSDQCPFCVSDAGSRKQDIKGTSNNQRFEEALRT
jgi:hypothetical protein